MNQQLRKQAANQNLSLVDYLMKRISILKNETGVSRTIFAACPNSAAVIKASIRAAKRNNAPIKFAATLNQVDMDGGYTGLTPAEFVKTIRREAGFINFTGPVIVAIDHGGPWLKDKHNREKWSYEDTLNAVKKSFEAAIEAGYDLIHVDPTIDITLKQNEIINIDVVAERTVELIVHAENFRRKTGYARIAYEVGTEEVHGGLADIKVFTRFFELLKKGLKENNMQDIWPCFVVGKVGTDLHTSTFDASVAIQLTEIAASYGSVIKGHYTDNVTNPEDYPRCGIGAANVGPEFTEAEYEGLMELCGLEEKLSINKMIDKTSRLKEALWNEVIQSGRWKKWAHEGESAADFYANSPQRQLWFIKTGCRYIWQHDKVVSSRAKLYQNLKQNYIHPGEIVLSHIERAMDKYFYKFNLVNLNDTLQHTEQMQQSLH